jgi:hypothetical protein
MVSAMLHWAAKSIKSSTHLAPGSHRASEHQNFSRRSPARYSIQVLLHYRKVTFYDTKFSTNIGGERGTRAGLNPGLNPSRIRDVAIAFPQPDHRKSKIGLLHGIKGKARSAIYFMTKSEFWFSTIPPTRQITCWRVTRHFEILAYIAQTSFMSRPVLLTMTA